MFIIVYGPEGSGKSTQAKLLAQKIKIPLLSTGDLVRIYAKEDKGIMGEVCKRALNLGHYVPDSEMFVLWKHRLKQSDVENNFVLEGFPRNMSQALFLDDKLEKYKKEAKIVIYLAVREKESIKRLLKRGRRNPDGSLNDSLEKIRERLRRYKAEEKDVIQFYKKKNILQQVNGERSIEEIHGDILNRVQKAVDENNQK